jgi:hypothetical protein
MKNLKRMEMIYVPRGNTFRIHVRVICKLQKGTKSQTLTAGSNIDHMTVSHDTHMMLT